MNPFDGSKGNLEKSLEELPEQVAEAKEQWRMATWERKKREAIIYAREKDAHPDKPSAEIKARIPIDESMQSYVEAESKAERQYTFLYEKLLTDKHLSGLRRAY